MSQPTQQDRERAAADAQAILPENHGGDDRRSLTYKAMHNMARVLLALLAEREAPRHTPECIAKKGNRPGYLCTCGYASGWRAGLLELAEWLETSRGGLDPLPEPRAYYEGQRDVLGNVASRARAMVSEQPRTPSRMDDPDE